ncbi:MAG: NAD(P)/FAD-dependent oxidoreductase [Chloroflexi bacterium]|nr:NAD(P)/FAD-dependent oxidoreductase [Chloroflexota bacterium]
MAKIERVKYLIIGNSAGGIGAAEAIRTVDKTGAITIVSEETYPAYSRPLISDYLAHGRPLERMLFRPADFYQKHNIQTELGKKVERLDLDEQAIVLPNRKKIRWEKLLLATGGLPIVPQLQGSDRSGVFTFTTLDDAKAINQFLNQLPRRAERAVVIGGGLIGVSATEGLTKRGVKVTIVEMKDWILNVILDKEAAALEQEALEQSGVEIITGHTVTKVNSYTEDSVTSVTLDDGRPIPCNLLILAIGVRPRIELVSNTGIKTNRGIVVDRFMATSHPDVYACGDVAEAYDFIYGENRLSPIWPNAYMGGRTAGFNMAGVPTQYRGGTAMNSLEYFGLAIASAGMVTPPDDGYEVLSAKHDHTYKKVILKDGLVMGMVFTTDIEKSGIVLRLMKDRINVEGFKRAIIGDDFGLVSLPEELWRSQLEMPSAASVSPVTSAEPSEEEVGGE